jgi:hypothetical protein
MQFHSFDTSAIAYGLDSNNRFITESNADRLESVKYFLSWDNGTWFMEDYEKPEYYGLEFLDYVEVLNITGGSVYGPSVEKYIEEYVYSKERIFPLDSIIERSSVPLSPGGEEMLPNLPLVERDYTFSVKEQRQRVE